MAGIDLQRRLHRIPHHLALALRMRLREAAEQVGIVGMQLHPLLKGLRGERKIVLGEGNLAPGQIRVAQVGVELLGGPENLVEHDLGIGPERERRLREDHHAGRIPVGAGAVGHVELDLLQNLRRPVRVATAQKHLPGEPAEPDAPGILGERIGHRRRGVGIAPDRQQALREEQRPFLVARLVLHAPRGQGDGLVVIARPQQAAHLRHLDSPRRQHECECNHQPQQPAQPPKRPPGAQPRSAPGTEFVGGSHSLLLRAVSRELKPSSAQSDDPVGRNRLRRTSTGSIRLRRV